MSGVRERAPVEALGRVGVAGRIIPFDWGELCYRLPLSAVL